MQQTIKVMKAFLFFFDAPSSSHANPPLPVMFDAIKAGKRVGAIYKEPTITPTLDQVKSMNLKKMWRSPNGAMRAGWNGISISRDTIHIPGMDMGYYACRPVSSPPHLPRVVDFVRAVTSAKFCLTATLWVESMCAVALLMSKCDTLFRYGAGYAMVGPGTVTTTFKVWPHIARFHGARSVSYSTPGCRWQERCGG